MRSFFCLVPALVLCGCGEARLPQDVSNTQTVAKPSEKIEPAKRETSEDKQDHATTFPERANEYVAAARRSVDTFKTESATGNLVQAKSNLMKLYLELNQPKPESKEHEELQRLLKSIFVNFGVAADSAGQQTANKNMPANDQLGKNHSETVDASLKATIDDCDRADKLLKEIPSS